MAEQLMREDSVERGSDGEESAEGEAPRSLDDIIEAYAAE